MYDVFLIAGSGDAEWRIFSSKLGINCFAISR